MPLNVRRFCTSVLLVLSGTVIISRAQTVDPPAPSAASNTPPVVAASAPTAGELMRDRISKAKAFIAVRNYNAAIYELENIRRESGDPAILSGVNVLLMNSYLEQGDYKRAQDFLNKLYAEQKTTKPNAAASYRAVAGQVVKGARDRADRYRVLGLNITDRTLPLEALNDLEKMRETLEIVITQSKELGADKARSADAMALLEEATASRSIIARDDYDARRWKNEVADTREAIASSRSVVLNAVNDNAGVTVPDNTLASVQPQKPTVAVTVPQTRQNAIPPTAAQTAVKSSTPTQAAQPIFQPVADNSKPAPSREREVKVIQSAPNTDTVANVEKEAKKADKPKPEKKPETQPAKVEANTDSDGNRVIEVGSLIGYATRQAPATYPAAAKSIRATGLVRVDVTVDESGDVTEVKKTSGPALLQAAARDAIRKWKFKPFMVDGQPVRANGFIDFNFAL